MMLPTVDAVSSHMFARTSCQQQLRHIHSNDDSDSMGGTGRIPLPRGSPLTASTSSVSPHHRQAICDDVIDLTEAVPEIELQ